MNPITKFFLNHSSSGKNKVQSGTNRSADCKSRSALRGFWEVEGQRPVQVADPEKLLHIAADIQLTSQNQRRLTQKQVLPHKAVTGLILTLFQREDRQRLRELEHLFSGGGQLWEENYENLITNIGLDHALDVVLSGGTQDTSWFVGLLGSSPSPAAGWTTTEIASNDFVDYDESTLQAFVDGGVSSQSLSNSASTADFTCSTNSSTVGGAFLIGTNTKATPAGTLYAAGAFTGGNKSLDDDDTISVTATFTAADA